MDEFVQSLSALLSYIEANASGMNQETQSLLTQFLGEVNDYINPQVEATLPTGAGMLWHISGGDPDVFVKYLSQVPDAALNSLLNSPPQLQAIIRRLAKNQPKPQDRQVDGIEQAPLNSSNIFGYQYDPGNKKLYVRFQGDGVYEYDGVPAQIFQIFKSGAIPAKTTGSNQWGSWWTGKNPSLGASFYNLIKSGGYPYQKVA